MHVFSFMNTLTHFGILSTRFLQILDFIIIVANFDKRLYQLHFSSLNNSP